MMKKRIWITLLLAVILGTGAYLVLARQDATEDELVLENDAAIEGEGNELFDVTEDDSDGEVLAETDQEFLEEKKSAHWESNTPLHEDILPAAPINVVVDVNFDLAAPSSISIMREGKEYGVGETTIDANKLALRRAMDATAPDGRYAVQYKACWPDGSCHDGLFQFEIDRTMTDSYDDMLGKSEVTITLADFFIEPAFVRISKGTTVVWQNDDEVNHYINSDGHPAHTYFPNQNSKELLTGDTYRVTFTEPGYYPYHCSTHPDDMQGVIVVE